jgi:hypothetical protein
LLLQLPQQAEAAQSHRTNTKVDTSQGDANISAAVPHEQKDQCPDKRRVCNTDKEHQGTSSFRFVGEPVNELFVSRLSGRSSRVSIPKQLKSVSRLMAFVTEDRSRARELFRVQFASYFATGVYNTYLAWVGHAETAARARADLRGISRF